MVKAAIAQLRDWRKAIDDWLFSYRTTPQPPTAGMSGMLSSLQPNAPIKINPTSH